MCNVVLKRVFAITTVVLLVGSFRVGLAIGAPLDLRGQTPEESLVTVGASKPSGAVKGIITLAVYDADFPSEGQLVINGNAPIALFGAKGTSANDQNSTSIEFSTPASYWKNGQNNLLFRHTSTQGFIIDDVSVKFNTGSGPDNPVNTFPLDFFGQTPEEALVTVGASKPSGAVKGIITLTVYDADFPSEGQLVINGNAPIALFGAKGTSANDQNSTSIEFSTPASYWKNGQNNLLFRHTSTQGFIIDDVSVKFNTGSTPDNLVNAFPLDFFGQTPEEALVTVGASKPSGAVKGIITLTIYDADFPSEGQLVINGNAPIALFGAKGTSANDQNSTSIEFSTPASYWKNGQNNLLFRHTSTQGFIIDDVSVSFDTGTGGATGGSFPLANLPDTLLSSGLAQSGPIVLNGKHNVVIDGLHITNPNGSCIEILNGSSNIAIVNSIIGPCAGKGIDIQYSSHVSVNGNYIHDTANAGVLSYSAHNINVDSNVIGDVTSAYAMGSTADGNLTFTNNYVKNVHRRNGIGGNVVTVSYVRAKGIRINNNVGINVFGQSDAEDLVNIYKSNGKANDPIQVNNNRFYGGGPSLSGGGIILGDDGGSYQEARNNILVNPGQYGIAISEGHHNVLVGNKVYSSDQRSFTNSGLILGWVAYTRNSECYGHEVSNNEITFWQGTDWTSIPFMSPHWKWSGCEVSGWDTNKFDTASSQPANQSKAILPQYILDLYY